MAVVPWELAFQGGIVGPGGWHCPCHETAGIVVPIINETALAAAPQLKPGD